MGGGSLAIVEKKPPFGGGAGGCAGGVLFHLLDWHRRLARKRRLFSPRRLLPSAVRGSSSLRRLPPPPPPSSSAAAQQPRPAPGAAAVGLDGKPAAPPGVVARLMGLESWPSAPGAAPAPRPQKQRKVEAASSSTGGGDNEPAPVVVMLPSSRRAPTAPGSPAHAPRSHHSADLPARSPRHSRLVHAAAARLLDPGAQRVGSKSSARMQAVAYACSSPQHRGHPGASSQQSWGTLELDDFLSRCDSMPSERRAPPAPPAGTHQREDNAVGSCWQEAGSMNAAAGSVTSSSHTIVLPRTDFDDANRSTCISDVRAMHKDCRARAGGMGSYAGVRSSNAGTGARTGQQRMLRKRGALSRPDVPKSAGSGNLVSSTRSIGNAGTELVPASSRRAAHNSSASRRTPHNSGPRRESTSSTTPQRSTLRDVIDRSGPASTSMNAGSASGQRRGSHKKIDRGTAGSNRGGSNAVAFGSGSSLRPVSRASLDGKDSENRGLQCTHSDSGCTRMPAVDAKCSKAEPCAVGAMSEKEEFRRLLKAKVNELGLSDRVEPSDGCSTNLTVSVLQELISALTNDTNTSASRSSNCSDSSAPLDKDETVYDSNDQSPDFHKRYQFQGDQGADSSATCTNDEPNQPSPTSVLEACFSNDASSLGSPTEKIESTEFFVSMENKIEDLFNLESDIVDLSMSIDTTKSDDHGGNAEIPCVQSSPEHDLEFLEGRLHSIGEAIANAELLLDSSLFCGTPSSLSLHSFIVEMLETVEAIFCSGPESSFGFFKEENKCQGTNFMFDCIVESLDLKFRDFGKCGYREWLRLPLTMSKDLLKREIAEDINGWREPGGEVLSDRAVAEKEFDQVVAARWDVCRPEAFDISVAIEDDILEALVSEFAFDQCC